MLRFPTSWTKTLASLGFKRTHRKSGRRTYHPARRFESLEARRVMATVADTQLFYNNSIYDDFTEQIDVLGSAAIATDKVALRELEQASFSNYSSYHRGINGLIIDIEGRNAGGSLTANDFIFRKGVENAAGEITWEETPGPSEFQHQRQNGSDRVVLAWSDATAVKNAWLQVTVKANSQTRFDQREAFYFGSAVGETGDAEGLATVNGSDYILARRNFRTLSDEVAIDSAFDINRDGRINGTDLVLIRRNFNNQQNDLPLIQAEANTPTDVEAQVFSPSEIYLRWKDQSKVETGYRVTAYNSSGQELFTQTVQEGATAALVEGLAAGTAYQLSVAAISTDGTKVEASASAMLSVETPERLTSGGSAVKWWAVSLGQSTPTRGTAGSTYQSGSLSLNANDPDVIIDGGQALVQAESYQAAVVKAVTGSVTIKHPRDGNKTFSFSNGGAFDVGTKSTLEAAHSGYGVEDFGLTMPGFAKNNDQKVIVLENLHGRDELSNDNDYDDFLWKVTAVELEFLVDLEIDNTKSPGTPVIHTSTEILNLNLEQVYQQLEEASLFALLPAEIADTSAFALDNSITGANRVWNDSSRQVEIDLSQDIPFNGSSGIQRTFYIDAGNDTNNTTFTLKAEIVPSAPNSPFTQVTMDSVNGVFGKFRENAREYALEEGKQAARSQIGGGLTDNVRTPLSQALDQRVQQLDPNAPNYAAQKEWLEQAKQELPVVLDGIRDDAITLLFDTVTGNRKFTYPIRNFDAPLTLANLIDEETRAPGAQDSVPKYKLDFDFSFEGGDVGALIDEVADGNVTALSDHLRSPERVPEIAFTLNRISTSDNKLWSTTIGVGGQGGFDGETWPEVLTNLEKQRYFLNINVPATAFPLRNLKGAIEGGAEWVPDQGSNGVQFQFNFLLEKRF